MNFLPNYIGSTMNELRQQPDYYHHQLLPGWNAYETDDGRYYYANSVTGESQWLAPYQTQVMQTQPIHDSQVYAQQPHDEVEVDLSDLIDEDSPYASFLTMANYPHLFDEFQNRKRKVLEEQMNYSSSSTETNKNFNTNTNTNNTATFLCENQNSNIMETSAVSEEALTHSTSSLSEIPVIRQKRDLLAPITDISKLAQGNSVAETETENLAPIIDISNVTISASSVSTTESVNANLDLSGLVLIKLIYEGSMARAYDMNKPSESASSVLTGSVSYNSSIIVQDSHTDTTLYSCTPSSTSSTYIIRDIDSALNVATFRRRTFHTSHAVVRLLTNSNDKLRNLDVKCTSRNLEYSIRDELTGKELVSVTGKKENSDDYRTVNFHHNTKNNGNGKENIDPAFILSILLVADSAFSSDR